MAWFECGSPDDPPVLVLHGGPGGRSRAASLAWFDGLRVRCIAFDQRGCGLSTPAGGCEANTLDDLVDDIERLRGHLGLDAWAVAGGSWGATVAVSYAARHPARVRGLFLRSSFLGSVEEVAHFFAAWPRWLGEDGARFLGWRDQRPVPDPVALLQHGTAASSAGTGYALRAARIAWAWDAYEQWQSRPGGCAAHPDARLDLAAAERFAADPATPLGLPTPLRVQWHYLRQRCFLTPERMAAQLQVLDQRLRAVPVSLVHGDADAVCDVGVGRGLAQRWPHARWWPVPGAGHAMDAPVMRAALVNAARHWVADATA